MLDTIDEFTCGTGYQPVTANARPTDGTARERMLAKRSDPARDRQASADRLVFPSAFEFDPSVPSAWLGNLPVSDRDATAALGVGLGLVLGGVAVLAAIFSSL